MWLPAGNNGPISKIERAKAKVVTYGIVYGSGPAGEQMVKDQDLLKHECIALCLTGTM